MSNLIDFHADLGAPDYYPALEAELDFETPIYDTLEYELASAQAEYDAYRIVLWEEYLAAGRTA